MNKIITALLCLASLNLFASDAKEFFEKATVRSLDYSTSFGLNPELGRAWIVITEIDDSYEESSERDFRVKLDGLSYNAKTQEIVYTDEDQNQTVCAYYEFKKGIFGYKRVIKTNNCQILKSYKVESIDNGFEIKKILKAVFTFSV